MLGDVPIKALESIELVRLPSPPHILTRLLELCDDTSSDSLEFAALIGLDPALTVRLLMTTPAGGSFVNLKQTIDRLGLGLVRTAVEAAAVQQLYAGLLTSQKTFVCRVWLSSYYSALFARELAQALDPAIGSDAYLAGLLHDFGQVLFDARQHDSYPDLANDGDNAQMLVNEQARFGITHPDLGAAILGLCHGLNPAITDAVSYHHENPAALASGDLLCRIVAEADQIGRHWGQQGAAQVSFRSALVDESTFDGIVARVREHVVEFAGHFGIVLNGARALTHEAMAREIERDTLRMARRLRDATLTRLINGEARQSARADSPAVHAERLAGKLQLYFSIFDIALLIHEPADSGRLALYTAEPSHAPSRLAIDGSDSLLVKSFVERQGHWITADSVDRGLLPVPDRQVLHRLGREFAWAQPMVYAGKTLGVIIIGCDRAHRGSLDKLIDIVGNYAACQAGLWLSGGDGGAARGEVDKLIHEISNPLSVVKNYIEVIKGGDGTAGAREIDILEDEVQRMHNIILNFRQHGGADSGPMWLNAELEASVPLYLASFGDGRAAEVGWNLDPEDSEIGISRDAFRQIVLNLVKNAVEAQPEELALEVSSRHFANIDGRLYAQFSITDRGDGVEPTTRTRLFSPLASGKPGGGRGVGLAVVADILRGCGGQIKYLEIADGGATFEVLIPLKAQT